MNGDQRLRVFFDGDCPLCRREVQMVEKRKGAHAIDFVDIADPAFLASDYGVSWEKLMAEMHAILPDGTWIQGVDVFREMYSRMGFRRSVAFSRLRGVRGLLDWVYRVWAANRLRLTGRCSKSVCEQPMRKETAQ